MAAFPSKGEGLGGEGEEEEEDRLLVAAACQSVVGCLHGCNHEPPLVHARLMDGWMDGIGGLGGLLGHHSVARGQ